MIVRNSCQSESIIAYNHSGLQVGHYKILGNPKLLYLTVHTKLDCGKRNTTTTIMLSYLLLIPVHRVPNKGYLSQKKNKVSQFMTVAYY